MFSRRLRCHHGGAVLCNFLILSLSGGPKFLTTRARVKQGRALQRSRPCRRTRTCVHSKWSCVLQWNGQNETGVPLFRVKGNGATTLSGIQVARLVRPRFRRSLNGLLLIGRWHAGGTNDKKWVAEWPHA